MRRNLLPLFAQSPATWRMPLALGLACVVGVTTGCRGTARRGATSTVVPGYSAPATTAPSPTPIPSVPSGGDLVIPPPPGESAQVPALEPMLGGGFTRPNFDDAPVLPEPTLGSVEDWGRDATDEELIALPPIQTTGSDEDVVSEIELPPLPSEPGEELAAESPAPSLTAVEAETPLPNLLPTPEPQPVELDRSLFLLELEAEALAATPTTPAVPVPPALPVSEAPRPASAPKLRVVGPSSVPTWPADGETHDIVVAPGPTVPKWSTKEDYWDYAARQRAIPRRLAVDVEDGEWRRIE